MDEDRVIKLRYLDIAPETSVYPVDEGLKDKALARLGIERLPGQTPFQAWIFAMCRENGLPEKLPATEVGDAVIQHEDIKQFAWWLA